MYLPDAPVFLSVSALSWQCHFNLSFSQAKNDIVGAARSVVGFEMTRRAHSLLVGRAAVYSTYTLGYQWLVYTVQLCTASIMRCTRITQRGNAACTVFYLLLHLNLRVAANLLVRIYKNDCMFGVQC